MSTEIEYGKHLFVNYLPAPVAFARGEGSRLWDTKGKEYVDFLAGIATCTLGHAHPRLVEALTSQLARYHHVTNLFRIPEQDRAANLLIEAATSHRNGGTNRLERAFFCNSGAEANEAAIKLVRKHAWRRHAESGASGDSSNEILVTHNGFHGRTLGALAATGTKKYHEGFAPLPGGFRFVPFGDLDAARAAMTPQTCAVLIEPVQGEGGVHPGAAAYLQGLEALCREHEALFVLDEVQTGVGRSGASWFAFQRLGLEPDVVTLAKGLGAGVPVAAVLATDDAARALQPGDHGSTFGGNPLSTTAVRVVLETIRDEGLLERVREAGERLASGLEVLARDVGHITEIRGPGLMKAVETDLEAPRVAAACLEHGLIVNAVRPTTVRMLPPLVITNEELDEGIDRFAKALAAVASEAAA